MFVFLVSKLIHQSNGKKPLSVWCGNCAMANKMKRFPDLMKNRIIDFRKSSVGNGDIGWLFTVLDIPQSVAHQTSRSEVQRILRCLVSQPFKEVASPLG